MVKIGDLVKVLDEETKGTVVRIHQNRVTIETREGFEQTYNRSELLKDEKIEIESFSFSEEKKSKNKIQVPKSETVEIDLHIGQLVDSYAGLSNFEMLQIQLRKVRDEIELARIQKRRKIIFIHGHGSGKLKTEVHKLLSKYEKLEFYDAAFRKYKLGATEVELY